MTVELPANQGKRPKTAFWFSKMPGLLVFAGGLSLTAAIFTLLWSNDLDKSASEFRIRAENQIDDLKNGLIEYSEVVVALQSYLTLAGSGERMNDFDKYAATWIGRHTGVQALIWAPRVAAVDRSNYEAAKRLDRPGFRIFERGADGARHLAEPRDSYFPIDRRSRVSPNDDTLGYDLGSDPERRRALEKARDSGRPAVTRFLALITNADGILLFLPVYRQGPTTTIEERREALAGFAVGVFRATAMIEGILARASNAPNVATFVFDGPAGASSPLIFGPRDHGAVAGTSPAPSPWRLESPVQFGDRQWSVVVAALPGSFPTGPRVGAWFVLVFGLAGTLLTSYFAQALVARSRRLEASMLTAQQEVALSSTLVDSLPGLFVLIDKAGRLLRWNRNAQALTGHPDERLRGSDVASLVVDKDRAILAQSMQNAFATGFDEVEVGIPTNAGEVRTTKWISQKVIRDGDDKLVAIGLDVTETRSAQAALIESRQIIEGVFNSTPVRLFWKDKNLVYLGCNTAFARDSGLSGPQDLIGKTDYEMGWRDQADLYRADDRRVIETGQAKLLIEEPQTTPDGRTITLLTSKIPLRRADGEIYGVLGTYVDITDRKRAEDALRASEERFRAVSETAQDAIIMVDGRGTVEYWNRAAERILGYTVGEAIGKNVHEWLAPARFHDQATAAMPGFAADGKGNVIGRTVELAAVRKDGTEIPIELSLAGLHLGNEWHAVSVIRDITERKRNEQEIRLMARRDFLTGLANRTEFVERLEEEIARAQRGGAGFAVLYLDLDHFKDINDTLGHPVGDLLLKSVGQRLKEELRETDIVARFGGDEFGIIASNVHEPSDVAILAQKLMDALGAPYSIEGKDIHSGTSIGIAIYGPDGPDAEALLKHSDVALYRAKSEGRGIYRFFAEAMDKEVRSRVELVADLREALGKNQFFLVYHPQVEVRTGRIMGLEALVRWQHPTRGVVPPVEFIQSAEKSGLIDPLGRWVLRQACRQAKAWLDLGIKMPKIAVNLSVAQFHSPLALEQDLMAILAETGLPPKLLELEFTESILMEASPEHLAVLLRLRQAGLRIAMDDFGTGYSSLSYLSDFPLDVIKIAQHFMFDLKAKSANAAIVKAAIGLANDLGLEVIVEGVETEEQLTMVSSWGGTNVQGFYFSKPLPANEVSRLLRDGHILRSSLVTSR